MSKVLSRAIISWVLLFALISLFHGYMFHLAINKIPGFYSGYSDIFVIGGILTFVSLASTGLLFLLLVYITRKTKPTNANLIRVNIILLLSSLIAIYLTAELAASWWEGLYYFGFYAITFAVIINIYFRRE